MIVQPRRIHHFSQRANGWYLLTLDGYVNAARLVVIKMNDVATQLAFAAPDREIEFDASKMYRLRFIVDVVTTPDEDVYVTRAVDDPLEFNPDEMQLMERAVFGAFWFRDVVVGRDHDCVSYRYVVKNRKTGKSTTEASLTRTVNFTDLEALPHVVALHDAWQFPDPSQPQAATDEHKEIVIQSAGHICESNSAYADEITELRAELAHVKADQEQLIRHRVREATQSSKSTIRSLKRQVRQLEEALKVRYP